MCDLIGFVCLLGGGVFLGDAGCFLFEGCYGVVSLGFCCVWFVLCYRFMLRVWGFFVFFVVFVVLLYAL